MAITEVTTALFYGQKVYIALPRCACSENVHDISYTKLGLGYVRKYITDNDSYMVEVTNVTEAPSKVSFCVCCSCDEDSSLPKPELKEIARKHIFVLDLPDRNIVISDELTVKVGDIINVYPYADKFKIIAANSNMTTLLICNVNGIANTGSMNFDDMKLVDLEDPSTFISIGDGTPVIPYRYDVVDGD